MRVTLKTLDGDEVIDKVSLIREFDSGIVLVTPDDEVDVQKEFPSTYMMEVEPRAGGKS